MAQERIINRELSEGEIKEIFGFEKVWNGAERVLQEWGKIYLPQRGEHWHHRWLFTPEEGKLTLAVDFWKEASNLVLIDPESEEELGNMQMPKFKGLWVKPQFDLDRGESQVIGFREDVNGQKFTLTIEPDGRFTTW